MARLDGKIALITGAAGGIGRATAALFRQEGARVVASDIDTQALGRVQADMHLRHDVTLEADWRQAMTELHRGLGPLDVLVNNAGVALTKGLEETSFEDWRRVISVNLDSVFLGVRQAIGAMKERPPERPGEAVIVNVSSIAGVIGAPMLAAYSAAKGGVRLFTKSAALYCADRGYRIRINSIHPGFTETAMLDGIAESLGDSDAMKAKLAGRQPLRRLAEPDEIARAILFLASEDSSYMTGAELHVDGGYSAQ